MRNFPAPASARSPPRQATRATPAVPFRIIPGSAYCALWRILHKAHLRRHVVRAGDANPVQLRNWTDAWLDRIRDLYHAHDELTAAWQEDAAPAPQGKQAAAARLEKARAAWDDAITVIDEARKKQMQAPGLAEPAKKALATLDREWDGITAHRDYPMVSLDNYPDVAVMPKSGLGGAVSAGRGGGLA